MPRNSAVSGPGSGGVPSGPTRSWAAPLIAPSGLRNLVGEAGGHLAERGQALALLDPLVGLARLDHPGGLGGELAEGVDVVEVERAVGAVVADREQAEQPRALLGLGRAEQREDQGGVELLGLGDRGGDGLAALGGGRIDAERVVLAAQELEVEVADPDPVEEGAGRGRVEPLGRGLAEAAGPVVACAVGVEQVDRGVGDPARLLEGGDDAGHHVGDVDHADQLAAEAVEAAAQLGPGPDQPAVDAVLEAAADRLEQDQDHERRDQRVEQLEALLAAADPRQEQAVDRPQEGDQGAEHRHLADQLVDVDQAVAEQGLRDEVEVEDREDVARGRPGDAEPGQEVGQGQGDRDEAAEREVADADALDPLLGRPVLDPHVVDAAVEAAEDVGAERDLEPDVVDDRVEDRRVDEAEVGDEGPGQGHPRRPVRAADRRLGQEAAEERDRGRRDRGGGPQREPAHQRAAGGHRDEVAQLPGADDERERGERGVGAVGAVLQQHRRADREDQERGQERRDRLDVHAPSIARRRPGPEPSMCSPGRRRCTVGR